MNISKISALTIFALSTAALTCWVLFLYLEEQSLEKKFQERFNDISHQVTHLLLNSEEKKLEKALTSIHPPFSDVEVSVYEQDLVTILSPKKRDIQLLDEKIAAKLKASLAENPKFPGLFTGQDFYQIRSIHLKNRVVFLVLRQTRSSDTSITLQYVALALLTLSLLTLLSQLFTSNQVAIDNPKQRESEDQAESYRRFLSDLAHDLRTPLTSIRGYLETVVMKDDKLNREERLCLIETALKNSEHMSSLISEIFEFTKFEDKSKKLKRDTFQATDLLNDIFERFIPQADKKQIQFTKKLEPVLGTIQADRKLLDRALSNLVNNAIYYTRDGNDVEIQALRRSGKLVIQIRDQGVGIPEEELEHIFDRFYRVAKDRSRTTGGTGLGLAITKTILDAHNGTIRIESKLEEGTLVTVELPL